MEKPIRVAAKAIIIRDKKILMIKLEQNGKTLYDLPGGGQQQGETLAEALERECMEEIGARVRVGDIVHVYELIAPKHPELAGLSWTPHAVKIAFACELVSEPDYAKRGDEFQTGVVWLPVQDLHKYPLHPSSLPLELIMKSKTYLGEVF